MASIVLGAAASHAPGIVAFQDMVDPEMRDRYHAGMQRIADEIHAARPDVMVFVTNEHFVNFYLDNVPAMCLGIGTGCKGPTEPWLGAERVIPGDRPFARALLAELLARDFDVAFSEELVFDHGTMVPLHFIDPEGKIPMVPLIMNNIYEPMPSPRRAHDLGVAIADAVRALPGDQRVAIVATGGLSHRVGTPDAGVIDPEWDERFLAGVEAGDGARLAGLTHEELAAVGNGTHEVRNWLAVMGAVGDVPGEVVVYEPAAGWMTGCGAALWKVA